MALPQRTLDILSEWAAELYILRANKQWAEADTLRDIIRKCGLQVRIIDNHIYIGTDTNILVRTKPATK